MSVSRPLLASITAAVLGTAVVLVTWLSGALATAASRDITWTSVASQPYGTLEGSGIELNGKLYSFGGYDTTKINTTYTPTSRSYVYDPATNKWSAIKALPAFNGTGHGGITHAGVTTDGTSIYLAGGYSSDSSGNGQIFGSREVYRYDPGTDTYTRLPDMPAERAAGGLAYLDGELHFISGTNRPRDREAPEHWSLKLSNLGAGWTTKAPLAYPRNHLGAAVLNGKIYVVGGQTGQDAPAISSARIDQYTPSTDSWKSLPPIPQALSHTVATVLDGQVVVMGGQTSYNVVVASVYAYSPATNAWTALTPLPAGRFSGTAGTINGSIYYAGGSANSTTYKGTPVPVAGTTPTATTPKATTPAATTPKATTPKATTPAATTPKPTTPAATTPAPTTPTPTTPTTIRRDISFQPLGAPLPPGFTADTGLPYNATRSYGWVREDSLSATTHVPLDLTPNTRDRDLVADQRVDTFIHMQAPANTSGPVKTPGAWEIAVPTGNYQVTVGVGDAGYFDSRNTIRIEGQVAINGFVPSASAPFSTNTLTVRVTDGRLTIDGIGGTNTKLDYVVVRS